MGMRDDAIDPAKADLIYRSKAPRNGEPRLDKLVENWITPTPQFYIRSHGANPAVVADEFRVSVEGMVDKPLSFSIQELTEKFPTSSCTCTVSCAGIRRYEFNKVKEIKGVAWQEGPIGNAVWSGVRLSDVLKAAGIKQEAKHVWFEGADEIVGRKSDVSVWRIGATDENSGGRWFDAGCSPGDSHERPAIAAGSWLPDSHHCARLHRGSQRQVAAKNCRQR